jgi:hypothetical protein
VSRIRVLGGDVATNRREALAAGLKRFYGRECPYGHGSIRRVENYVCEECGRIKNRLFLKANPENNKKRWRRRKLKNPEAIRSEKLRYCEKNREKEAARSKRWRDANKARKLANVSGRKAHVKRATPSWVDRNAIAQVYADAAILSASTGIKHHVDHIVPLRGKLVSGLHVPWNLRPFPAIDNLKKGAHHAD